MAAIGAVVILAAFVYLVSGHHECERPCREGDSPKNCYYHFTVSAGFEKCVNANSEECQRRMLLTINGRSPGPCISVCEGDTITIDVRNVLPSGMETSFHWHGLRQRGRPHMDGVPMVTQCPIHAGTTFRYAMTADRAGTFYYRAHSVFQQLDGLSGALIVRRDATVSRVIFLAPQLSDVASIQSGTVTDLSVSEIKSASYFLGGDGQPERIRLINAAALDCSLNIVSDDMTVVALDGNEIQPIRRATLVLHPGERADIHSVRDHRIFGMGLCAGTAIPESVGDIATFPSSNDLENYITTDDITLDKDSYRVFIPFDVREYSYRDNPTDFRYKLGEVTPITPSYLSDSAETVPVYQFSNVSFLYPSSPLLSQPNDIDRDMVCSFGTSAKRCGSSFCECLNVLRLPFNQSVDLIVIDEGMRNPGERWPWCLTGKHGKTSQTVHLHGHTFRVTAAGSFNSPTTANTLKTLIESGKIQSNLVSPVEKDTIAVPNPGFVSLRLKTDNPGDWLLESIPSKARSGIGLEMILSVRAPDDTPSAPENFPRCGTLKPPDLVIIDE